MSQTLYMPEAGALQFHGPDARAFLQGQLSNDLARLAPAQLMLAGAHTAQGRVLALVRLLLLDADRLLAVTPRELCAPLKAHLSRFVLRSKLRIEELAIVPDIPGLSISSEPAAHLAAIANGIPQVYTATSGAFVAQMLNLDCLEAIAFDKGCYTGQEVIARAHYRGRVKRRMQRFRIASATSLQPGGSLTLSDGHQAAVVDAALESPGVYACLAVVPLSHPDALPLPYPLPK